MTLGALDRRASLDQLEVFGALHTTEDDGIGIGTLALLGPKEPGFWQHFSSSPEYSDGLLDPLDRWSTKIIDRLAADVGACAFYPFGRPSRPFLGWALRSGRAWVSPVMLLVHDTAGLMVSYRGAVLLPDVLPLPLPPRKPCDTCDGKPCLSACPVSALTEGDYDLRACHAYLDTPPGRDCLGRGCAVRRSCPAGAGYDRLEPQSAFHMESFHPCR